MSISNLTPAWPPPGAQLQPLGISQGNPSLAAQGVFPSAGSTPTLGTHPWVPLMQGLLALMSQMVNRTPGGIQTPGNPIPGFFSGPSFIAQDALSQENTMIEQLFQQLASYHPESAQAQQIMSRISMLSDRQGASKVLESQLRMTGNAVQGIDRELSNLTQQQMAGGLTGSALTRMQQLQGIKMGLLVQLDALKSHQTLVNRQDVILSRLPYGQAGEAIRQGVKQLQKMELNTPEVDGQMARLAQIAQGQPEPLGTILQGVFLTQAQRQLTDVAATLYFMQGRLNPSSPEAQGITTRLQALAPIFDQLDSRFRSLLPALGF